MFLQQEHFSNQNIILHFEIWLLQKFLSWNDIPSFLSIDIIQIKRPAY